MKRCGQGGYLLLPMVIALLLVAVVTFMLNRQGAASVDQVGRATEIQVAQLVAEAGFQHALWQANQADCQNYSSLIKEPFGRHSYSAFINPTDGSPVTIRAAALLASGSRAEFRRNTVPIYSATATQQLTLQPGSSGKDSFIEGDSGHQDHNKGGDNELKTSSLTGQPYRALLEFDVAVLPPSTRIVSALLGLQLDSLGSKDVVEVHRLLRDWTEMGVTWTLYDGSNSWTTPGGDYDPTLAGSFLANSTGNKSVDIAPLVQAWVEGSQPNHGVILLSPPNPGGIANKYFSSDNSSKANRPMLTITFACECGTPCGFLATDPIILSTDSPAVLGGLSFQDKDLAEYGPTTDTATLFFEGGPAGLASDIAAAHVLPNKHIILSTADDTTFGGLSFKDEDLIDYDPVTDIATMFFDGSTHFNNDEDIRSVHVLADGHIIFSTDSDASIGALNFEASDLVEFNPVTSTASLFFDSSTTTLNGGIDAVHVLDNGQFVLSTKDDATLGGLNFGDDDLVIYDPVADTAALYLGGGTVFDNTSEDITSVHISIALPPQQLLLVVLDPFSLTAQETTKKALIESWGHTVNLIDVHESQAVFDTAITLNDVVYITEDVNSNDLGTKLKSAPIGVVTEEDNLSDEFGMSDGIHWGSGSSLTIDDNTHYITAPFALGPLTILGSSEPLADLTGSLAVDLATLGSNADGPALAVLEIGAALNGGGTAAGRRAQLPWGGNDFDVNNLTADGLTIFRRAIEWGAARPPTKGILFVVPDAGSLGPQDTVKQSLMESWGYVVAPISAADTQAAFDTAVASMHGVYISEEISSGDLGTKLRDAAIGIVNEESYLADEFGFSSGRETYTATAIDIVDSAHYITAPFATGPLTIVSSSQQLQRVAGTLAGGLQILGESATIGTLVTINPDGLLDGGGTAAFRRVQLPWGNNPFDINSLNADGLIIMRRALEWATGSGTGGGGAAPGAIGHWTLDDGAGPIAADSAGSFDGTLVGGPTWTTGQLAGALDFDGAGDYVLVGSMLDAGSQRLSVSAWVFKRDGGDDRAITKSSGTSIPNHIFSLGVANTTIRVRLRTTDNGGTSNYDADNIALNNWTHVAFTYDGATLRIYHDGTETGTHAVTGDMIASAVPVVIGNLNVTQDRYWNGLLDDVRVYDRALSPAEVAALAAGSP